MCIRSVNLAKNIVERNNNGILSVKNDEKGAVFTVKIYKDDEWKQKVDKIW